MSDDELGELSMERLTEWRNAGANDQLRLDRLHANLSWEDFLPTVAEKNRQLFGDALLSEGWEDDATLSAFADLQAKINLSTLLVFTSSAWNSDTNPENIEGYARYIKAESTSPNAGSTGNGRLLDIAFTESDNSHLNFVPDDQLASTGSLTGIYTIAFQVVGSSEKIVNYRLDQ